MLKNCIITLAAEPYGSKIMANQGCVAINKEYKLCNYSRFYNISANITEGNTGNTIVNL